VTDLFARVMAQKLTGQLGQSFIIDNRGGASGMIGADYVAKSKPDGYTILFCTNSQLVSVMFLNKNVPYDPFRDFTPIMATIMPVEVLVVRNNLPVKNMRELIDYAKAHPGKLSYGSAGVGSVFHLNGEALNFAAGIKMLHVPYKSPVLAMQDVVGGQVDMAFTSYGGSQTLINAGKLKLLANLEKERYKRIPNVPTVRETLPDYEKVPSWFAVLGPAKLPQAIVSRLNSEFARALKSPDLEKWMAENGAVPVASSPAELTQLMKSTTQSFSKLVKAIGIKPE
jgi:tripartite-type tricarboxylate transporter receptor subunit TctC